VYFRFTAGLLLAMAVSMAGTWLEKCTRSVQREVSLQHYQADVLRELIVRRRLDAAKLTGQRTAQAATAETVTDVSRASTGRFAAESQP